jgi:hypothetical protein
VRLQQARRANPYPWTWEIPVAGIVAVLLVMVIAVHAARTVANAAAGGGWQFTPPAALFRSLPGLLAGDATAGLAGTPDHHAGAQALWVWTGVAEAVVLAALIGLLRGVLRRWGPGRVHGMASPGEADRLLGQARLRRNAAVIRPDLHHTRRRRAR